MNDRKYQKFYMLYASDEWNKGRQPMDYEKFLSVGLPRIAKLYTKDWQEYLKAVDTPGIGMLNLDSWDLAMVMQYDFGGYRKRLTEQMIAADRIRRKAEANYLMKKYGTTNLRIIREMKEEKQRWLKNLANKDVVSRMVGEITKRIKAQNTAGMTREEIRIAERKRLEANEKRLRNKQLENAKTNAMILNINNTHGSVIPNLPTDVLRMLRTELTGKNSQKTPRAQAQRDVNRAFNNMGVKM